MDATAQYANPKHFNAYAGGGGMAGGGGGGIGGGGGGPTRPSRRPSPTGGSRNNNNNNANASSSTSVVGHGMHVGGVYVYPTTSAKMVDLASRLSQYARQADRRQALRTLGDPAALPRTHVLGAPRVEDIAAAEREAADERAILNGVKFLKVRDPSRGDPADDGSPVDSYFLQTLREICGHVSDMDGVSADPMALYGGLLLRLSRSVSERDALGLVTAWTSGRGELVALPLKRRHHDGASKCPVPAELELYVEGGCVHARVVMRHEMGLFLRTALESHGLGREVAPWNALILAQANSFDPEADGATAADNGEAYDSSARKLREIQNEALASPKFNSGLRPWVFVDADVVERINFGTGASVRTLHVNVPGDKNSGYVKKW